MSNYYHLNNGEQVHLSSTNKTSFGRLIFILDHSFKYKSPDGEIDIVIPEGEETDGASVPFLFWMLFPPIGPWLKTAVVHDYLYRQGKYSRRMADKVFLYDCKYSPIRMRLMWFMLRLFGWLCFKCKRNKK